MYVCYASPCNPVFNQQYMHIYGRSARTVIRQRGIRVWRKNAKSEMKNSSGIIFLPYEEEVS